MLGWKEIAQKTADAFKSLPLAEQRKTLIFSPDYGICGAINHYAPKSTLPEAYSDNASYLIWMPQNLDFQNVLFIGDPLPADWPSQFSKTRVKDKLNSYARESGTEIVLFENANAQFKLSFDKKIASKKNKFSF